MKRLLWTVMLLGMCVFAEAVGMASGFQDLRVIRLQANVSF